MSTLIERAQKKLGDLIDHHGKIREASYVQGMLDTCVDVMGGREELGRQMGLSVKEAYEQGTTHQKLGYSKLMLQWFGEYDRIQGETGLADVSTEDLKAIVMQWFAEKMEADAEGFTRDLAIEAARQNPDLIDSMIETLETIQQNPNFFEQALVDG